MTLKEVKKPAIISKGAVPEGASHKAGMAKIEKHLLTKVLSRKDDVPQLIMPTQQQQQPATALCHRHTNTQ